VDEKSDEAILPKEATDKGWRHLAEVVREGPHPKGKADRRPWFGLCASCTFNPLALWRVAGGSPRVEPTFD